MINVGIIGSGFIVPRILETFKEVGNFKCRAISSPHNYERLKELKEVYEIDKASLNYLDVLKDESIELVYIATPNSTHYQYAKESLMAGKSVLLEKPFTKTYEEAVELIDLANDKGLMIYEAIMTPSLPNFKKIREFISTDTVKSVELNFSQYSHRYDDFKKGIIKPVFSKELAGGALMDLNVYNIAFCIGLFGEPINVEYYPNFEQNIDVSGKLLLSYPQFEASLIAAKNKQGPTYIDIITDGGIIHSDNPASTIDVVKYKTEKYMTTMTAYFNELKKFEEVYTNKNLQALKESNNLTLKVMKVIDQAAKSAGLF